MYFISANNYLIYLPACRVSNDRLTVLTKWYRSKGLQPKERGDAGRANSTRAFGYDDHKRATTFVSNYAEDHALVLPGRVPAFKRDDIRLMPSSETKVKVFKAYSLAMLDSGWY